MYVIIIVDDNQRSIFICCSMINHSISNKMISLNSLNEISAENNPIDTSRRRRTPSKYAESIRQLTKMTSKNSKREKNSEDNQDESPPMHSAKQDKGQALACILPSSGRKLKLSIIIKKSQKPKMKKIVSAVSIEKEKEKQKQKTKNVSLLQTLMQVVEQYKADEQNKREQNGLKGSEVGSGELQIGKKESRPRKQKEEEEKYCRLYDKYRSLNEKFQLMQNQLLLI